MNSTQLPIENAPKPGRIPEGVIIAGLCLLVVLTYLSGFASLNSIPGSDQGVFLLEGRYILQGKAPYVALWDHKGPLLYLLNALGLLLAGGNRIGVWLLEVVLACFAYVAAFRTIAKYFGRIAASCGVAVPMLMSVACLNEANMTESWGLIFALLTIWLFDVFVVKKASWSAVAIGACGGAELLLRPNLCGMFLAAILAVCVLHYQSRELALLKKPALLVCAGLALVVAPVLLYLGAMGAIGDFIDCYITYNMAYVKHSDAGGLGAFQSHGTRWETFQFGFMLWHQVASLACIGWLFAVRDRFFRGMKTNPLILLALISLPVEMIASCTARFTFEHYFLLWCAPAAILVSLLLLRLGELAFLKPLWTRLAVSGLALGYSLFIYSMLEGKIFNWLQHPDVVQKYRFGYGEYAVADYILKATQPNETVFIWGMMSNVSFYTGRPAGSRFLSQMPFVTPGYTTDDTFKEFDQELESHPPQVIIDSRGDMYPLLAHSQYPSATRIAAFMIHNYRIAGRLEHGEPVFEYGGGQ